MRSAAFGIGLLVAVFALAPGVRAAPSSAPPAGSATVAPPPAPSSAPAGSATVAPPPAPSPRGVAVVAAPGSIDTAWPLARAVYAEPSLRAASFDETHARILCGEAPPPDAPADVRDLAETVAAIRGDDAPSRTLLAEMTRHLAVRAILVVFADPSHPTDPSHPIARPFLADTGAFDAATYSPDPGRTTWTAAVQSLVRTYGSPGTAAPALATHAAPAPAGHDTGRPFYVSPWFWSALGVATATALATYFIAHDSKGPTIHLVVQVPHQ